MQNLHAQQEEDREGNLSERGYGSASGMVYDYGIPGVSSTDEGNLTSGTTGSGVVRKVCFI